MAKGKVSKTELKDMIFECIDDILTGRDPEGLARAAAAAAVTEETSFPQPVTRVTIETDNELLEEVTPFLQHPLGLKYRDKVSGFEGIAESVHIYLNGCERYSLQGAATKDGKIPGFIFDGNTLELLTPIEEQEPVPAGTNRGGPATTDPLDTHEAL